MTDDPIQLLRRELLAAAHRRAQTQQPAPTPAKRWTRKRSVVIAVAALVVAAPATAAVTGSLTSGSASDGSSYTITHFVAPSGAGANGPPAGERCQQTDIHSPDRSLAARRTACSSAATPAQETLAVGFKIGRAHV